MNKKYIDLFNFLNDSRSQYHTVNNLANKLTADGYERLYECDEWKLREGGKYFVIRNGSSIIAFRNNSGGFMIAASHSDSPAFRVKGDVTSGAYVKLETEKYGGMIHYTWLDRPLTVAGRVLVRDGDGIKVCLADIGDKKLVIPSLAIHMNRSVNESCKLNPASDLLPLASLSGKCGELFDIIAKNVGASADDIVSHELFLTVADEPMTFGLSDEMILSSRLDDLGCVYSSLSGFLSATDAQSVPVLAVFDNEEVGSETKQGAASTFLYDTLKRICKDESDYLRRIARSFMVSADNAHAIHPNHPEMADRSNAPVLGRGIVIKYNANQRYATDAISDGIFREICKKAGVEVQSYFNRADLPGGSTLGSISDTNVSVPTVDIGIPQLAMHSANECCALADIDKMIGALTEFYSSALEYRGESLKIV